MRNLDLLNWKIFKTMVKLSTPLMLTAFIQMTYTLTDIAWIGRLSTEAVAAAGQVGFALWIASSLMLIPRIGMSVLTAQAYGARDEKTARSYINNGFWLALIMGIIFGSLLIIYRYPFIHFFKLDEDVNQLTEKYLIVIAAGVFLFFINPVLSGAYNSLGNSKTPFAVNALGLVINILLDPILIFGLGPIPALGISGAAMATIFAQFIVFLLYIYAIYRQGDLIYRSRIHVWTFNWSHLKAIFKIGLPPSIQSNAHALVSVLLNRYVASYGAMPLAVTSVGSNIESISWMTTEGFAVAITAMVGQNYGAKLYDRVEGIYQTTVRSLMTIGTVATLVLIVFRMQFFKLFIPDDPQAIALGAIYLLVFGLSQLFMSFEIGGSGFLNGLGKTQQPATVNTVCNLLRIPFAWLFMPQYGVVGVWIAMSLSTILKGVIIFILTRYNWKKLYQTSAINASVDRA
ncbi:MATE family efflux transporter [Facklamia miroungae]|uniref:Probable multidrug resistance protein NorM n=1 Tax=Facklamia miroungae TaxID=120956 RepID=A0A1G7QGM2_9LACT|nr:MATE family efflux transporter [Facklamia miroungae]NKZ28934.1 MATE family efflux transporter [Facklamia miroungae]SDF97664.1 putative efflux protein, MATE family [Facklamia miroungae]